MIRVSFARTLFWLCFLPKEKKDNEYYARMIKSASSPSSKAMYRKSKVDHAARHDRAIESYKRQIESAKNSLKREK